MLVWNTVVGGETGTTSNENDSDKQKRHDETL